MSDPAYFVEHFDLYEEEIQKNIYSVYEEIREQKGPVARSDRLGGYWLSLGYHDTYQVAQDWEHFSSVTFGDRGITPNNRGNPQRPPIGVDPPLQLEWRRMLNPWFSPGRINKLEAAARAIADDLIDEFVERGTADLVSDFASQLPGMVFFRHIIQVPLEDLDKCRHWVDVGQLEKQSDPTASADAWGALDSYLAAYLSSRKSEPPKGDLVDSLMLAELAGRPLSLEEILPVVTLLLAAGLETTTAAIANSLHHLGIAEGDRTRLIEEPDIVPTAVEEFLRYEGSIHGVPRIVTGDVELCGLTLHEGEKVLLSYGGANRDPEAFDHADQCVIDRQPNRHLAFGIGVHRCIGSHLARMNMRVSIEQILARMPDYRLLGDPTPSLRGVMTRGYTSLPVEFTPGSRVAK